MRQTGRLGLALRNLVFTIVVPGTVGVYGPYRWVRNPMYIAVLTVVIGEAWLYLWVPLLAWAGVLALAFHLAVVGYEEPTLARTFGETYAAYRRAVWRWLPMPPGKTIGAR